MSPVRLHPTAMESHFRLDNSSAVQRTTLFCKCGAGGLAG